MADPRDPLGKLRAAITATHSEIRNAVACLEVARPAFQSAAVAERLSGTRSLGHASKVVRRACVVEALMATARLWDIGPDSSVVRGIRAELEKPAIEAAIVRQLEGSEGRICAARERIARCCDSIKRMEGAVQLRHQALIRIRNKWLAHREMKHQFNKDGGATLDMRTLDILLRAAALISCRAQSLIPGGPCGFDIRVEIHRRRDDGERFWSVIAASPRTRED